MIRYPLQPLLDAMRSTMSQAQKELGVGGGQICRYRDRGMPREVAERYATRAGFHVYEVWPEMVEDDDASSVVCGAEDCPTRFVPSSHRQRYCTPTCRTRQKVRRWRRSEPGRAAIRRRRTKPEVAERLRERRRAYYRENGEYERARQRRYDTAKRAERKAS